MPQCNIVNKVIWGLFVFVFSSAQAGEMITVDKTSKSNKTGLLFEVTQRNGQRSLFIARIKQKAPAVEKITYKDGAQKTIELPELSGLEISRSGELQNPQLDYISLNFELESAELVNPFGESALTLNRGFLSLVYNKEPGWMEVRILDRSIEHDLIGRSDRDQVIRAGFGIGMDFILNLNDDRIVNTLAEPFFATVTGLYAFSSKASFEANIQVKPLFALEPLSVVGAEVTAEAELSYELLPELSAFVRGFTILSTMAGVSTRYDDASPYYAEILAGIEGRW